VKSVDISVKNFQAKTQPRRKDIRIFTGDFADIAQLVEQRIRNA
jgi:hypothetical protein